MQDIDGPAVGLFRGEAGRRLRQRGEAPVVIGPVPPVGTEIGVARPVVEVGRIDEDGADAVLRLSRHEARLPAEEIIVSRDDALFAAPARSPPGRQEA